MRGLAVRQRITSDNIANVETPNFVAKTVDFESSLRDALGEGESPMGVQAAVLPSSDAISPNSSNVNIDKETVSMIDTGLRFELMVQGLNSKFNILRSAMRG